MSNRTELRTRLREEVGDTGSAVIWSDRLLDDLLVEAAGWYSRLWPRQTTAYRDVADGERTFTVPQGTLGITGVECPPGQLLPQEATPIIGVPANRVVRQSWSLWGNTLYLGRPARGDEAGASHLIMRLLVPWDRPDPDEAWNGPQEDERLLVIWAAAEAWAWLDGEDQKRGRPSRSGAMTKRYAAQLEQEIAARRRAATSHRLEAG